MNILLLLLALIAIAFVSYWFFANKPAPVRKVGTQVETDHLGRYETAEEVFPVIDFPPDPLLEHVPDLPLSYGETRLSILPRDPEWLYAYWEINDEFYHHLQKAHWIKWENSFEVLRIHDITELEVGRNYAQGPFSDIRIEPSSNNWYIHAGQPNRTYYAELGRILNDGTFIRITQSNVITTPSNSVSDIIDPEWMLVSGAQKRIFGTIGKFENVSSLESVSSIFDFRKD